MLDRESPPPVGYHRHIYRALPNADRAATVYERLHDAMSLGLLRVGDKLPSEADLTDRFGVSLLTVREALNQLRAEGLVETRRGRTGGTYIIKLPLASTAQGQERLRTMTMMELRDLGDHRYSIIAGCVRLAATRVVPEEIEAFKREVAAFDRSSDPQAYSRHDTRIWLELASMSQSKRMVSAQMALQLEISDLVWAPYGKRRSKKSAVDIFERAAHGFEHMDVDTIQRVLHTRVNEDTYFLIDQKLNLNEDD